MMLRAHRHFLSGYVWHITHHSFGVGLDNSVFWDENADDSQTWGGPTRIRCPSEWYVYYVINRINGRIAVFKNQHVESVRK